MKVAVNKINELKRELKIEVNKEHVDSAYNAVYEEIKKNAKIPGFRPGTAPRHLLEKNYGNLAREEVIKKLLPETYHDVLQQEKLDAVSLPEVKDVSFEQGGLRYTASIEIRPTIQIKDYKGIKVKKRTSDVNEEEMSKSLETIKKNRNAETVDDTFAKGFGYAGLTEFKEALKRQLMAQKESDNKMQLESEVIAHLLKHAQFTVPESLVERRYQELRRDFDNYLKQAKLPAEELEKKQKEFDPKIQQQAEEQVKVFLVLDEIAQREKIERDDKMPNRVMEFLFQQAEWIS